MKCTEIQSATHELVLRCEDPRAGYRAFIALHSTRLGPAVGGTRFLAYPNDEDALLDALRLSRGMSYKAALANVPFGGGKGVLVDNGAADRRALLECHAQAIDSLGGRYITAEDVGTTVADMEVLRSITPHVAGLTSGMGDPSPYTAHGVVRGVQACVQFRFGRDDLAGTTIAIQGTGAVGANVARELHALGAQLIVADTMTERARRLAEDLHATIIEPDRIYDAQADVFVPCALGAVLNASTIPRLRASVVVGAANNQLATPEDAERLRARDITYGPDYVANAGGIISGSVDILGWAPAEALQRIEAIHDTMYELLSEAAQLKISPAAAADRIAEGRIARGAGIHSGES